MFKKKNPKSHPLGLPSRWGRHPCFAPPGGQQGPPGEGPPPRDAVTKLGSGAAKRMRPWDARRSQPRLRATASPPGPQTSPPRAPALRAQTGGALPPTPAAPRAARGRLRPPAKTPSSGREQGDRLGRGTRRREGDALPQLSVLSANIHPAPAATLTLRAEKLRPGGGSRSSPRNERETGSRIPTQLAGLTTRASLHLTQRLSIGKDNIMIYYY